MTVYLKNRDGYVTRQAFIGHIGFENDRIVLVKDPRASMTVGVHKYLTSEWAIAEVSEDMLETPSAVRARTEVEASANRYIEAVFSKEV